MGIGGRLIAAIAGLVAAVFGLWIVGSSGEDRVLLREQLDAQGRSLARSAAQACLEPLIVRDYPVLQSYARLLADRADGVVSVEVHRKDGTVVASFADAIDGAQARSRAATYRAEITADDHGELGPIGWVEVELSSDRFEKAFTERTRKRAWQGLGAVTVLSALVFLIVRRMVSDPLRRLEGAARRIGRGDLEREVPVDRTDELGQLARALETMRRELRESYGAIRQRNHELEIARDDARSAERAKTEFLSNMSHEIRTPLTAIIGFAERLAESEFEPESGVAVEAIRANGRRLLDMLEDVLDLASLESGKATVVPVSTDPAELFAGCLERFRSRAVGKGLELRVVVEPSVPRTLLVDGARVVRIVDKLVDNAIKFTDEGGVQVRVTTPSEGAGSRLRIDVEDTGCGIPELALGCVFEPFAQADGSSTRAHGGAGIGSSIARQLAQALGGDVSIVQSRPGRGTTVRVEVTVQDMGERFAGEGVEGAGEVSSLDGWRVLLVEDGPDNQLLVSRILEREGAQVTVRENGQLALDTVLGSPAGVELDVIIMDLQMPVMDGIEATTRLREAGFDRPIIALTAHAREGTREACFAAGCTEFMTKPVRKRALVEMVARFARAHDLTRS